MFVPKTSPVEIRSIRSSLDLRRVHKIQKKAFGYRDIEVMPASHLLSVQHTGGLTLGAYLHNQLVGFIYGYNALPPHNATDSTPQNAFTPDSPSYRQPYFFSHRLAVLTNFQNRGIATKLKLAQRDIVLAQGMSLIVATYDPLAANNALINIEKLGGIARTYVRDSADDMETAIGLASDGFLWEWDITSERTLKHLEGDLPYPKLEAWAQKYPQVNFANWMSDLPCPIAADLEMEDEVLLVHVPSNITEIKRRDLNIAAGWRKTMRVIFETYFDRGYVVTGFACDKEQQSPNVYKLEKYNIQARLTYRCGNAN